MNNFFFNKKSVLDSIDWDKWLYSSGMPPVNLKFDQTIANKVKTLAEKIFNEEILAEDPVFFEFKSNQKREFLSQLLDKVKNFQFLILG